MPLPGIFFFTVFYIFLIQTNEEKEGRDPMYLERMKMHLSRSLNHPYLKSVRGMLKGVVGWTLAQSSSLTAIIRSQHIFLAQLV